MTQDGKNLYADKGKWLYMDESEDVRNFWKSVTLPREEDAKWYNECTDEEKKQWEEEHKPQPEPEQEE